MKKVSLILTILFILNVNTAFAQTPTSAQPTPSGASTITPTSSPNRIQEIKERVEERIQEIKERAQTKAFWGTISQINNTTLILETTRGEKRVKTTDETKILLENKDSKFSDLAIGNFVIVMGSWDTKTETLTAKRLLSFAKPPKPAAQRQAIFGKVSDLAADEQILVVTHPKKPGVTYEVKVSSKTVLTKKVDGKMKKVDFKDIQIGDRLNVVALKDKEGAGFTAKILHVIPGQASGQEILTTPTPISKNQKATPTPVE